jgi:hypothetical protein
MKDRILNDGLDIALRSLLNLLTLVPNGDSPQAGTSAGASK